MNVCALIALKRCSKSFFAVKWISDIDIVDGKRGSDTTAPVPTPKITTSAQNGVTQELFVVLAVTV